jgi:hypothetical protein
MKPQKYNEPVSRLLTYGLADWDEWDDYTKFGFTAEHIPELIRMGTDRHLLLDEDVDELEMWAPMHAWRALSQMQAKESLASLVPLLALSDQAEGDLITEGLQDVLQNFGPAAIPPLAGFLVEAGDDSSGLVGASETLSRIGEKYPEYRQQIIHIITAALEARCATNKPDINGFWIADLLDLKAVESYPIIKKAFEEDMVDPRIAGDLEEVEIELGLRQERSTPVSRRGLFSPSTTQKLEHLLASPPVGLKGIPAKKPKSRKRHKKH